MPYTYYKRLKPFQKKIYDQSDGISYLNLPQPDFFKPILQNIAESLHLGNQSKTEENVQRFVSYFCQTFRVPLVKVRVLEKRPSKTWGELHGLYQAHPQGKWFLITIWMRTAKRIQVVAFRTFLRTLLHEILHHMDYTYFKLRDSFHTEGFYKRESSLLRQLIGE